MARSHEKEAPPLADPASAPSEAARLARPWWVRLPGFVWAVTLYVALAFVHYRDVLVAPTQRLLGNGDAFNRLWRIWWWACGYKQWGGDPWFAPQITAPVGHHLAEAELTPLNMIPAVLVAKLTGSPLIGYTLVGFVDLVLVGTLAYLYARSLKASRLGSAFAGAVFMSAPYMALHWIGHMPLMGAWTLPLGLLVIERLAEALAAGHDRRALWLAAALGLSLGLAGWSSDYYAVIFGIAFAVYGLVRLRPKRTGRRHSPWGLYGIALAVALVFEVPLYLVVKTHSVTKMSWPLSRVWGAPPFAYFVPSLLHPLFSGASALVGHQPGENALYVGFVALVLAIVGLVAYRRRSDSMGALAWMAGVAYMLSLGPRLYMGQLGGWVAFPFHLPHRLTAHVPFLRRITAFGTPLPEILLALAPITDGMRQPDRFGVVVLLGVAALAALGFDAVASRLRTRRGWARGALFVVLLAVTLFEFASVSVYSSVAPRPVETWLSKQPGKGTVIWIPSPETIEDEEIYKTIVTGKPIAFGAATFPPPEVTRLERLLKDFPSAESVAALDQAGVTWIVWQKTIAPTPIVPGVYKVAARFSDVDVLERVHEGP